LLTQALRELMLLHSSDWQFLIHTLSAKDYAEQRFFYHHSDFNKLCEIAQNIITNKVEISSEELLYLEEVESRDSVFAELDLKWWSE
jgi:1,4-alpha-glucan branching enzyme